MSTVWFTSDTHWLHKKLTMEIRGFSTPEVHDREVINNYNAVIAPDDTVFHLGDFTLKNPATNFEYFRGIMNQLHGDWHLIAGNHDYCWPGHTDSHKYQQLYLDLGFKTVQAFAKRKFMKQDLLLSHFPYEGDHSLEWRYKEYRLKNAGKTLLHGHTHSDQTVSWATRNPGNACDCRKAGIKCENQALQIHVGLDAWKLYPVSIDMVTKIILDEGVICKSSSGITSGKTALSTGPSN